MKLGTSDIEIGSLGLGTWSWGDKPLWGYNIEPGFGLSEVLDAFLTSMNAGVTLVDTAEVYGHGESEKIVGWLAKKWRSVETRPLVIASKFGLLPGRNGAASMAPALEATLRRSGLSVIDLYQVHWPDSSMASIDDLMNAMADLLEAGKIRAIGVSNFSAEETFDAYKALARRGHVLASNQVHYSLLHRAPEVDGVLDACRELKMTLLAYSPLEMGLLTGRYRVELRPGGRRSQNPIFSEQNVRKAMEVLDVMRTIAHAHGEVPLVQVALNWLREKGTVVPIPGAKNRTQALANGGTVAWSLSSAEVAQLDDVSLPWRPTP